MDDEKWTDRDTAEVAYEGLPSDHPSLFVDVFRTGLTQLDQETAQYMLSAAYVTPESVWQWGDFTHARDAFKGRKISMTPMHPEGVEDIAYVRLVKTNKWLSQVVDETDVVYVTLVQRPDLEQYVPDSLWRIHNIGAAVAPEEVPRALL